MKVQVVMSREQILGLEARLEKCSRDRLAEKNHERHEQWYAQWEKGQRSTKG